MAQPIRVIGSKTGPKVMACCDYPMAPYTRDSSEEVSLQVKANLHLVMAQSILDIFLMDAFMAMVFYIMLMEDNIREIGRMV
jgi:hypothetical protein